MSCAFITTFHLIRFLFNNCFVNGLHIDKKSFPFQNQGKKLIVAIFFLVHKLMIKVENTGGDSKHSIKSGLIVFNSVYNLFT